MTTLNDIETAAKVYAERRQALQEIVRAMHEGIAAIKREHMPSLKRAINRAAERHAELQALVADAPELFARPKSRVFHGIKLGYQKAKGGIHFTDADAVVRLIRKHFPEQADVLIKTTEKPAKDALAQLTVQELKRVGCEVADTGDVVFIRPTDSEVDKLVDALLDAATEDHDDA